VQFIGQGYIDFVLTSQTSFLVFSISCLGFYPCALTTKTIMCKGASEKGRRSEGDGLRESLCDALSSNPEPSFSSSFEGSKHDNLRSMPNTHSVCNTEQGGGIL